MGLNLATAPICPNTVKSVASSVKSFPISLWEPKYFAKSLVYTWYVYLSRPWGVFFAIVEWSQLVVLSLKPLGLPLAKEISILKTFCLWIVFDLQIKLWHFYPFQPIVLRPISNLSYLYLCNLTNKILLK